MSRGLIEIGADLRDITDTMGALQALADDFESLRFKDAVTSNAAETAIYAFGESMDAQAVASPERLGHMYEWGEVGEDGGRLWRVIVAGAAGNKTASYDFKRSTEPVPVGEEETGIEGDTRTKRHVFDWKAQIVELGIPVTVSPNDEGGWLAIPTKEFVNNAGSRNRNQGGTMWFSQHTVHPPVNEVAQGQFTEAWVTHFSTVAMVIAKEEIADKVEDYMREYLEVIVAGNRRRTVRRGVILLASREGKRIGHNANSRFMTNIELENQILELERRAGYAD